MVLKEIACSLIEFIEEKCPSLDNLDAIAVETQLWNSIHTRAPRVTEILGKYSQELEQACLVTQEDIKILADDPNPSNVKANLLYLTVFAPLVRLGKIISEFQSRRKYLKDWTNGPLNDVESQFLGERYSFRFLQEQKAKKICPGEKMMYAETPKYFVSDDCNDELIRSLETNDIEYFYGVLEKYSCKNDVADYSRTHFLDYSYMDDPYFEDHVLELSQPNPFSIPEFSKFQAEFEQYKKSNHAQTFRFTYIPEAKKKLKTLLYKYWDSADSFTILEQHYIERILNQAICKDDCQEILHDYCVERKLETSSDDNKSQQQCFIADKSSNFREVINHTVKFFVGYRPDETDPFPEKPYIYDYTQKNDTKPFIDVEDWNEKAKLGTLLDKEGVDPRFPNTSFGIFKSIDKAHVQDFFELMTNKGWLYNNQEQLNLFAYLFAGRATKHQTWRLIWRGTNDELTKFLATFVKYRYKFAWAKECFVKANGDQYDSSNSSNAARNKDDDIKSFLTDRGLPV